MRSRPDQGRIEEELKIMEQETGCTFSVTLTLKKTDRQNRTWKTEWTFLRPLAPAALFLVGEEPVMQNIPVLLP